MQTDSIAFFDGERRIAHGTDFGEVLLLDVADGGLCVLYGGFCVGEVSHDDVSALADLGLLVCEGGLDLYGCGALLLGLLLVLTMLWKLVVGLLVFGLELCALYGEALLELFDWSTVERSLSRPTRRKRCWSSSSSRFWLETWT